MLTADKKELVFQKEEEIWKILCVEGMSYGMAKIVLESALRTLRYYENIQLQELPMTKKPEPQRLGKTAFDKKVLISQDIAAIVADNDIPINEIEELYSMANRSLKAALFGVGIPRNRV